MSLFYDSENYELSTSVEVDNLLAELPFDLIKESIVEQIDDPVSTNINYIDVIVDKCAVFKQLHENDEDLIIQINENLKEFFIFIITKINEKFDLGLDVNSIALSENIVNVGSVIYTYFILRYIKNISKFIAKFITQNKKSIADNFSDSSKKDVSTLAFKKQIKNREDLIIVTNLPSIIKYIINLDIEPKEFVKLSTGSDNYEGSIIRKLIDENQMIGNFVHSYMDVSVDEHDYILDEIQTDIKTRILKKVMS